MTTISLRPTISFLFYLLPVLILLMITSPDFAVESITTPQLAFRVQHDLNETSTLDATFSARFNEVFIESEREIAEVRYGKRMGDNEFMAAYNLQFDRRACAS